MCRHVLLSFLGACLFLAAARAAEVIPPAPRNHFNDYAGVVSPAAAGPLNAQLEQFERDTSDQILVVIYPHMQSDSSIEDYTVRIAQSWGVGQRDRKNGAVLFIFSQDRRLYVQVGYGLEGVLPDALCKQIIEGEITPRFRAGDFTGGVQAGVRALLAAVRGEYHGTGRTVADSRRVSLNGFGFSGFILLFVVIVALSRFASRNTVYSRTGRTSPWIGMAALGGGFRGGSFGGGGGGGSFSGGGGSFGGGGAGGSW
jgi:uncharacterized protein